LFLEFEGSYVPSPRRMNLHIYMSIFAGNYKGLMEPRLRILRAGHGGGKRIVKYRPDWAKM
jgi:hypothetical protein